MPGVGVVSTVWSGAVAAAAAEDARRATSTASSTAEVAAHTSLSGCRLRLFRNAACLGAPCPAHVRHKALPPYL